MHVQMRASSVQAWWAILGCAAGTWLSGCVGAAPVTCIDGVAERDCARLADIVLPDELPASPGNAHADDPAAAILGFHVFFDRRFSANLDVRCESCHSVDHAFNDNLPTPTAGLASGVRNAPTIFNAARYSSFLWDGRADSLWSQPLLALENPREMGFTRLEIVHLLGAVHASEYEAAFGPLPDFSDPSRFPPRGAPGDAPFDTMTESDRALVDGVVANLGKALEAYMRHLSTGPSVVDRYLADTLDVERRYAIPGEGATLDAGPTRGLAVFVQSGCLDCHSGPQLSDGEFHVLGVPPAPGATIDEGRSEAAIAILESSPFNGRGAFADAVGAPPRVVAAVPGGFRTPSLRNLAGSAPYGHNGVFPTLGDVVDFHLRGGGHEDDSVVVDPLLVPRTLSREDRAALIELLEALEGEYPALPWGQWPNGNG